MDQTTDILVIANVRDGVVYTSGSLTGTLKVPPVGSVVLGVTVDNTTGNAMISVNDLGVMLASYVI